MDEPRLMRASARAQLGAIALVQVLVMTLWFSMSAVVPAVQAEWQIPSASTGWLTTSVQLGFVAGALASAVLNLADRIPPHFLLAGSALVGAAINAAVTVFANGLTTAIVLRFLTGVVLAGVYPVGMKLMTTWFTRQRPLALGVLIGALALGSAVPHLVGGLGSAAWRPVLIVSSLLAVVGALLCLFLVRPGPGLAPTPPLQLRSVARIFSDRVQLRINLGYLGHMWELYALWTWLPLFLSASLTAWDAQADHRLLVGVLAFAGVGIAGAVGCVVGGRAGVRRGPLPVARLAMVVSACCCVLSLVVFGSSPLLLVPFVLIWGAAVIADSGQFSTALSQVTDPRYVGTALTVQTAMGFVITLITIHLVPIIVDLTDWRYALAILTLGPLVGSVALTNLNPTPVRGPAVKGIS